MMNPYSDAKEYQFWRKAISNSPAHEIDPVVNPKFVISRSERVCTAGSCFAQHISNRLSKIGFNYYIPEAGANLTDVEKSSRGYGVFSARYGNLYTVRQLLQLFEESFNTRMKSEKTWRRRDGRFVDPFRPNIEPLGHDTVDSVTVARQEHLQHVKDVFLNSEIFVFTLGLTEGWINKIGGDVFPLAPGVSGGEFSTDNYEFINFGVADVINDLRCFLQKLREINPKVKVVLTVSPVPLIATYEDRHVLVSTTYSKSVLRVAADVAAREFSWVDYFPSYEIINGNFNMGRYFEEDLRGVNSLGVSHAMRCFLKNYTANADASDKVDYFESEHLSGNNEYPKKISDLVCDEESISKISV
jgi:GSCFA family